MVFDRTLRQVFGRISSEYDQFREDYPRELFDDIKLVSELGEGKSMLEIGCGTGLATLPFAELGLTITGLDINRGMINIAETRTSDFPNVQYLVGSFEDTNFPSSSFDIIAAAQSWHWLNPDKAYKKAHDLLKNKGYLALFWKFQEADKSPLVSAVRKLFAENCPKFPSDFGSISPIERKLSESGLFEPAVKTEYHKQKEISRRNFMLLTRTYSWVEDLHMQGKDQRLLDGLSNLLGREKEIISLPYRYVLLMSRTLG